MKELIDKIIEIIESNEEWDWHEDGSDMYIDYEVVREELEELLNERAI